jgi:hypothetical protein
LSSYSGYSAGEYGALGGVITFEWKKPGPSEVAGKLMELAGYLDNVAKPLIAARAVAIADMEMHFDTESGPNGEAWAPLTQEYASRRGSDHPILQLTSAMKGAATSSTAYPVDGDTLFFNTGGLPFYWIFHQEGASRGGGEGVDEFVKRAKSLGLSVDESALGGGGRLPARPFVGISAAAELQIVEIFDMWFDAGVSIVIGSGGVVQGRGAGGRFGPRLFPDVGALSGATN